MCPGNELPIGVKETETETETKSVFSENIEYSISDQLFSNIVGYNDIKKLFRMSLSSEKPVHVLLVGPPASAKTLFMLECIKLTIIFYTG